MFKVRPTRSFNLKLIEFYPCIDTGSDLYLRLGSHAIGDIMKTAIILATFICIACHPQKKGDDSDKE